MAQVHPVRACEATMLEPDAEALGAKQQGAPSTPPSPHLQPGNSRPQAEGQSVGLPASFAAVGQVFAQGSQIVEPLRRPAHLGNHTLAEERFERGAKLSGLLMDCHSGQLQLARNLAGALPLGDTGEQLPAVAILRPVELLPIQFARRLGARIFFVPAHLLRHGDGFVGLTGGYDFFMDRIHGAAAIQLRA